MTSTVSRLLVSCVLLLSAAAVSYVHAGSEIVIALPNGYFLEQDRTGQTRLMNPDGERVVPEPIAGYAVYRHIVTGLVGPEVPAAGAYANEVALPEASEPRYFVLDTDTGQIEAGLTASAWKSRLAELGVSSPSIKAPLRLAS